MSKKKVLGRTFEEPYSGSLTDKNIFNCPPAAFSILTSPIPVIGLAAVVAALWFSLTETNEYGIVEQAWKVVVYGSIIQAVSIAITIAVFL